MKPTDLRIGNYAQTQTGDLLRVCEIRDNSITYDVVDEAKNPLNYKWQAEPILITDEWLTKKFDFEMTESSSSYGKYYSKTDVIAGYDMCRHYSIDTTQTKGEYDFMFLSPERMIRRVKYVHELQNVWHAHTGKELEYNSLESNKNNDKS